MKIRFAEKRDVPALTGIYNQAIREGGLTGDLIEVTVKDRESWLDGHDREKYPVFVAEAGDEILGYVYITQYRFGRGAFEKAAEVSYYVKFSEHGKGIGRVLLENAEQHARKNGVEHLVAILLANNNPSIRFLERNGYEEWGRMKSIAYIKSQYVDHLYYGKNLR